MKLETKPRQKNKLENNTYIWVQVTCAKNVMTYLYNVSWLPVPALRARIQRRAGSGSPEIVLQVTSHRQSSLYLSASITWVCVWERRIERESVCVSVCVRVCVCVSESVQERKKGEKKRERKVERGRQRESQSHFDLSSKKEKEVKWFNNKSKLRESI